MLTRGVGLIMAAIAGVILLVMVVLPFVWAVIETLSLWVLVMSLLVSAFIFFKRR